MKLLFVSLIMFISAASFAQEFGLASYYSDSFQGLKTANGELYDKNKMTAAHNSYPYGTMIRVTRLDNSQSVVVRVNDRGPFIKGRIVDVSRKAAEQLDLIALGEARVKVEVVGKGEAVATKTTATKGASKTTSPNKTATTPSSYSDNTQPRKASTQSRVSSSKAVATTTSKEKSPSSTIGNAKMVRSNFKKYGLYKIQLLQPEKKGYGVQVASYSNYENAMQQVATLQSKWFDDILINIEPGSGKTTNYKVILGQFDSQAAAENYKKNLKRKHSINGFVVGLSDM